MFFHRRAFRRRYSLSIGNRSWIFLLIFVIIILLIIIYLVEQTIEPMLLAIARTELKKSAQEAVLIGVKEVSSTQEVEELMDIEKDRQGKIALVKINSKEQAKLYSQITSQIQKQLKELNNQSIELSLGQFLQSPILSNYGPKIPIQLWPKGASRVSLKPKIQSAGINTVMVSLNLHVHTELGIIVPFSKENTVVDISYPLGEVMVVGEVPEYYFYSNQGEIKTLPTLPVPQK